MTTEINFPYYHIVNVDTNETLAKGLTTGEVDLWWAARGAEFFGLRVVEDEIQVTHAAA
jgi:hypothetical protein